MKSGRILALVGGLVLSAGLTSAWALTKDNPYSIIPDRNPFGLKPPPPPQTNAPPPPKVDPVTIKLTGISTLGGTKKVLIEYLEPGPGKTQQRPAPMREGDRQGPVEIVAIDPERGSVKVLNGGNETTLTFDKDGIKVGSGPVASAAPGVASMALPTPPPNVANPSGGSNGRAIMSGGGSPVASLGVPNPGPFVNATPNPSAGFNGAVTSGTTFTPNSSPTASSITRPLRVYEAPSDPGPKLSREEQIILMEAHREANREKVAAGMLPPLPPTELTPQSDLPPAPEMPVPPQTPNRYRR